MTVTVKEEDFGGKSGVNLIVPTTGLADRDPLIVHSGPAQLRTGRRAEAGRSQGIHPSFN